MATQSQTRRVTSLVDGLTRNLISQVRLLQASEHVVCCVINERQGLFSLPRQGSLCNSRSAWEERAKRAHHTATAEHIHHLGRQKLGSAHSRRPASFEGGRWALRIRATAQASVVRVGIVRKRAGRTTLLVYLARCISIPRQRSELNSQRETNWSRPISAR